MRKTIFLITILLLLNTNLVFAGFKEYYNRPVYNPEDRHAIRQEWKQAFGVDLFAPYFKVQEIQKMIKSKFSITCLGFKGNLDIDSKLNNISYTFIKRW